MSCFFSMICRGDGTPMNARRTGANKELAEESGSRTHQGSAGDPFSDLKSGRPTGDASPPLRAYQKCGFVVEGREREAAFIEGIWHDWPSSQRRKWRLLLFDKATARGDQQGIQRHGTQLVRAGKPSHEISGGSHETACVSHRIK
jgi:hypothetical protein